jgi:peptide/nickel transport system substrate-binding protein
MQMRLLLLLKIVLLAAASLAGCSPAPDSGMLRIGLAEEPRTLNIWLASDANSSRVLSQIYQPLYLREPDTLELVPWLAAEPPHYDPDTLCYTVKLRPAKWSDGTPFTAEDVAFTIDLVKTFKVPRYASRWRLVKRLETPDPLTLKFYLKKAVAIFETRALTLPIAQKKQWEAVAREAAKKQKPLASLIKHKVTHPVGTGPFVLKEWRQGAYLVMERNPHFFGTGLTIAGRTLGPYIDRMVFKFFGTSDVAILALKKGSIDMFWWGIQPGYLDSLSRHEDIRVFTNQKSALYYMGFNLRRPPFDHVPLRRAIATLIDKDFIIQRILQGYGVGLHTVVPPGNRFWSCPDVDCFGQGKTRADRVRMAHEILTAAGYTWKVSPLDAAGRVQPAVELRLPDGSAMKDFTILTPPADYDPHRAISGLMIQEWLRDMGMPAFARPMAFSSLLQKVKANHDFDAFILGYGKLSLDPDYVRSFFHSNMDKKRGWNMSGFHNARFDDLAAASKNTMDRNQRQQLLWEMQRIVVENAPYIPLYNPMVIEAVRTDRFDGWVEMLGGIGNIWTFSQLTPSSPDGS